MLSEVVGSGTCGNDVVTLVVAKEVDVELIASIIAHACEAKVLVIIVEVLNAIESPLVLGKDDARVKLRSALGEYLVVGLGVLTHDDGDALLYDARLLGRNLLDCLAEELGVVEAYIGYDAEDGCDEVCGIEAATEACLNNCHLDIALVEVVEGHGCRHLEEG